MAGTEKAPGLIWRKRRDGSQVAYWTARPSLVKAGYRPKTVRLHYAPGDPALVLRCHSLQAEMLAWSPKCGRVGNHYDGTFASLVRFYETNPDSPYHELEQTSARTYSKTLASLMRHVGPRRVDAVDGSDVRRWYKELVDRHSKGWAYYTVNVLKAVLSFAATKRIEECRILRAELREAKFNAGGRRKEFLTYDQVIAFRDAAIEIGLDWMGLCLLIQFECGMRRRDVIGQYVHDHGGIDGIRYHGRLWRDGLTWGDIDAKGIMRRVVSKTRFTSAVEAVHAVADYPDLAAELDKVPVECRIGPIVINPRTGVPPTEDLCRSIFRRIARKAGIPDNVWQMDARAGADTEAYEAGATEEETMALLTHTERKTSRRYLRDLTEQSRRAAAKRVGSRKE